MTEHEIDKLFDNLDRIEKRLDKLERAASSLASRDLKVGQRTDLQPLKVIYTMDAGDFQPFPIAPLDPPPAPFVVKGWRRATA